MLALRALQSYANSRNQPSPLTWNALNAVAREYGGPAIDYDRFAIVWESDPEIQNIVDRFDQNGLVIKTTTMEEPIVQQDDPNTNSIERRAKHAAKKGL